MHDPFPRYATHVSIAFLVLMALGGAAGCQSPSREADALLKVQSLETEVAALHRSMQACRDENASLGQRVAELQSGGSDELAALFAPVKIAFAGLTGGANFDREPGDDGISVYLQPIDRNGDVVKAPGRVTIQLLDNRDLESPRVVGTYKFQTADELADNWYGQFGAYHYTFKCPFTDDADLPPSGNLVVSAKFVDVRTGAVLTHVAEVEYSTAAR